MAEAEIEPSDHNSPSQDLIRATRGAVQVRAVHGAHYDHKHRRAQQLLGTIDDEPTVRQLTESLTVHGLDQQASWMTPGHTTLAFLGPNRVLLTVVTLLGGDWLRWSGWPCDARMVHHDVVAQVLAPIGVRLDDGPTE